MEWGMAEQEQRPGELLSDLVAEHKRQNRIRTVLGGGIFALFLIFGLTVFQMFRDFDSQRLEVQMNARASASLWPIVSEELDALIPATLPALDAAILDESASLIPRFERAIQAEIPLFQEQVERQGDERFEAALAKALETRADELTEYRQRLHADPAVAQQLYDDLLDHLKLWARSEIDHQLREQTALLSAIQEKTQGMAGRNVDESEFQDALMIFIEIVNAKNRQKG